MYQLITNECLQEFINKQIIIYGAGNVAKVVMEKLFFYNVDVLCLTVTERKKNPYFVLGKPVITLNHLTNVNTKETVVIIATFEKVQADIMEYLGEFGFEQIYIMQDALYYEWINEWDLTNNNSDSEIIYYQRYIDPYLKTVSNLCKEHDIDEENIQNYVEKAYDHLMENELDIVRLVVVLGTKCSLRCRDCSNLMPYYKPQEDFDKEEIITSLNNITEKTQSILKCELIGGEPFLSKNLSDVLEYVIKNEIIKAVEITTNGTIIPNEKLIPLLKNPKVQIRISDYGEVVDKSNIIAFLQEHSINYHLLDCEKWVLAGGVETRNKSKKELVKQYRMCHSGYYCKPLYKGKIFSCARAAGLYDLGFMKDKEYVEVFENFDEKEMKEFLLRDFSIACNYCDSATKNMVYTSPAVQLPNDGSS